MRRILLAFRVFFRTLFSADVARQVEQVLMGRPTGTSDVEQKQPAKPAGPAEPKSPARSEAITLLATLQREARLVDFVQESLEGYSDAQIGAVARDVHRDCRSVLDRLFALEPLLSEQEGAPVDVPQGFDAARYQLTGNVSGGPPFRGRLVHHGWRATKCEMPTWSGSNASARVVAPTEVELR